MIVPVAQLLGRSFPIVNWAFRHIAHGLVVHLMATEAMNFFVPMKLEGMVDEDLHPIASMIFKPVPKRRAG